MLILGHRQSTEASGPTGTQIWWWGKYLWLIFCEAHPYYDLTCSTSGCFLISRQKSFTLEFYRYSGHRDLKAWNKRRNHSMATSCVWTWICFGGLYEPMPAARSASSWVYGSSFSCFSLWNKINKIYIKWDLMSAMPTAQYTSHLRMQSSEHALSSLWMPIMLMVKNARGHDFQEIVQKETYFEWKIFFKKVISLYKFVSLLNNPKTVIPFNNQVNF